MPLILALSCLPVVAARAGIPACGDGVLSLSDGEACEPPGTDTCDDGCQLRSPTRCGNGVRDCRGQARTWLDRVTLWVNFENCDGPRCGASEGYSLHPTHEHSRGDRTFSWIGDHRSDIRVSEAAALQSDHGVRLEYPASPLPPGGDAAMVLDQEGGAGDLVPGRRGKCALLVHQRDQAAQDGNIQILFARDEDTTGQLKSLGLSMWGTDSVQVQYRDDELRTVRCVGPGSRNALAQGKRAFVEFFWDTDPSGANDVLGIGVGGICDGGRCSNGVGPCVEDADCWDPTYCRLHTRLAPISWSPDAKLDLGNRHDEDSGALDVDLVVCVDDPTIDLWTGLCGQSADCPGASGVGGNYCMVEACDDGNSSNEDDCLNTCTPAACGDGFVRAGIGECDDGNTTAGDGCDELCRIETGDCTLPRDGLVLYLDADAAPPFSREKEVRIWKDLSGRGNDFVLRGNPRRQVDEASPGRTFLHFDGDGDGALRLHATDPLAGFPSGSADRSAFLAVRYPPARSTFGGFVYGTPADNSAFGLGVEGWAGWLTVLGWGKGNDFRAPETEVHTDWLVQTVTVETNELRHYVDGTLIDGTEHTFATTLERATIAESLSSADSREMELAAVLLFDRALDHVRRRQVETFLRNRLDGTPCAGAGTTVERTRAGEACEPDPRIRREDRASSATSTTSTTSTGRPQRRPR